MKINLAQGGILLFWCPGCNDAHQIHTNENGWTFNGDVNSPTISPSIKVGGVQWERDQSFYKPEHYGVAAGGPICCHSFITEGRIQFLGDCTHGLAGQTVDLPEWPYT